MSRVNRYLVSLDGAVVTADRPTTERLLHGNKLLWLDLDRPDTDDLAMLRDIFDLHPLALKDVEDFGQRPKLEDFGDVCYLVTYGAQGAGESLVEIHCFISERYLITIRRDPCTVLEELQASLRREDGVLARHPAAGRAAADQADPAASCPGRPDRQLLPGAVGLR